MADFHKFATTIEARFKALSVDELFSTGQEDIFETYLAAYPSGTNPLFKTRTEFDCSCCKNFVRNIGHVVTLTGNKINTIWDVEGLEYPFDVVAAAMHEFVSQKPIKSVYRTTESRYGAVKTVALIDAETISWNHFFCTVPDAVKSATPDAEIGAISTTAQVFRRGLEEFDISSLETVLDLIAEKTLYRGAEFKKAVTEFRDMLREYQKLNSPMARDIFVWNNVNSPAARFRNSAIGTLVQDLSQGVDLEHAVNSFGSKLDPLNYKRPTTLITKKMIDDAVTKLKQLGLESAVQRRYARLDDVSVNNVLFVNNSVRSVMKDGGLTDILMEEVKPSKIDIKNAEPIAMDDFLARVVPQAATIDLLVENKHLSNFMNITTAIDPDAGRLFKWDNQFAWSYDGDAADSIKQRVKRAGGNVDAELRVSLAWSNTDDLDIHVIEPDRNHIYFGTKGSRSRLGGMLDVDMNVSGDTRDAVENVVWTGTLRDGNYEVSVNNFTKRESVDVGFTLEVEHMGSITQYSYAKAVPHKGTIKSLILTVTQGVLTSVTTYNGITAGSSSQTKWGIDTETLVPLDTLMTSPNHWDEQEIGNKHWFFLLKDCKNPDQARGIYNEFLNGSLEPHRKVFEVLGAKAKCPASDDQLSGIGFSSTRNDVATVVVKGSRINKAYKIQF